MWDKTELNGVDFATLPGKIDSSVSEVTVTWPDETPNMTYRAIQVASAPQPYTDEQTREVAAYRAALDLVAAISGHEQYINATLLVSPDSLMQITGPDATVTFDGGDLPPRKVTRNTIQAIATVWDADVAQYLTRS